MPLYFAAPRPVVERDGLLIMRDDDRMPLAARRGRGDAHGALPLAGLLPAVGGHREHAPRRLDDIIEEMLIARTSERSGRLIDSDEAASMEKKKREGYF